METPDSDLVDVTPKELKVLAAPPIPPEMFDPMQVVFAIPVEVWNKAIGEAITEALARTDEFDRWVRTQVRRIAEEEAKDNPHLQAIRDDVRAYLTRYPDITTDEQLEAKVATTILQHIQRAV